MTASVFPDGNKSDLGLFSRVQMIMRISPPNLVHGAMLRYDALTLEQADGIKSCFENHAHAHTDRNNVLMLVAVRQGM